MKLKTVTIGIPAFNEEKNITHILDDIMRQKTDGFLLEKVVVASDKSTDGTEEIVKTYKSSKVELLTALKREGQAVRQNDILKYSDSDILVLLNADTHIKDKLFIKKLITPLLSESADLTSSFPIPLKPKGFMQRVLFTSITMKTELFESYKYGQNIYTCHGRARGFSKKLYKEMKFKDSVGEDAYSYMYAITKGYVYKNIPTAKIYYMLPANFSDHKNQSIRFLKTKKLLSKEFGRKKINTEFALPTSLVIQNLIKSFAKSPIQVGIYLLVLATLKFNTIHAGPVKNTWNISKSSKTLYEK